MGNPNFLSANTSGIELMPGVNDDAVGYDVNRIIQALNGTNIVPITTGNLTVVGNETISGTLQVTGALVGPFTINPGPLTVDAPSITPFTGTGTGIVVVRAGDSTNGNFTALDFASPATAAGVAFGRIAMKQTGVGSEMHFGVSNNYASGITLDAMVLDHTGLLTVTTGGLGVTGGTTTDTLHSTGAVTFDSTETITGALTGNTTTSYFWDDFEEAGTTSLMFGNSKPGGMGSIVTVWHSLGTEAGTDNSIAYWDTAINGAWSFASHIASPAANNDSLLLGGHADWNGTVGIQIQGRLAAARVGGGLGLCVQSNGDGYYTVVDSTTAVDLYKRVSGVYTLLQTLTIPAITLGNPLWINFQRLGNEISWLVAPDSSGAPGAWTQSGGFNDTTFTKGRVALKSNHSFSDTTFGGAFNNVFVVKIPAPFNGASWTTVVNQGEPAFAWSDQSFNSGTRSLSIYNATNNGQGYWTITPSPALPNGTYTLTGASRGVTGATPSNFYIGQSNSALVTTNPGTVDNAWHSYSSTGACTTNNMFALAYGLGTYYFDSITTLLGNSFANGLTVGNQLWASGGISSQGPILVAPGLNSTPAKTLFGSLPVKFAEVVTDSNANNIVTIDHIPTWGRKLVLEIIGRSDINSVNTPFNYRFNGDLSANYNYQYTYFSGATANTDVLVEGVNGTAIQAGFAVGQSTAPANAFGYNRIEIINYADTSHDKFLYGNFMFANAYTTAQFGQGICHGVWHPATPAAINRIDVVLSAGNWVTGSIITVYIYP